MSKLAQSVLEACVVAVMAVAILMVPANAAAMLTCDDTVAAAASAHHGDTGAHHEHDHGLPDVSPDTDHRNFGSVVDHCGSHVCVVGVELVSAHAADAFGAPSDVAPRVSSLISLVSPDGPLRPPRV